MRILLPLLFLGCLSACSSQADTSYRGEPLASLAGSVTLSAELTSPVPALEAALLWSGTSPGSNKVLTGPSRPRLGTSVPVSGAFPAKFTLEIYEPPPAESLFPCASGGVNVFAEGQLAAVPQGEGADIDPSSADVWGEITDYLLVYADADVPAGTFCQGGNAVTKGFHLYQYTPTPDIPGCVRQAPDDTSCNGPYPYTEVPLSTEQTLVLSHEDVASPPPTPTPAPTP